MREIKFRAWDENGHAHGNNKKGIMVYLDPKNIEHSIECSIKTSSHHYGYQVWLNFILPAETLSGRHQEDPDINFSNLKWMQFTGLKDKNGKEIYDGDIVKNNDLNWEIYWDEGSFRMRRHIGENITNGHFLLMGEPQHSEVIGNIWENKDLIK